MRAVRPGFLTANEQIHPITAPATYLDSLVRVPNDQRTQTSESRQIAAPSSPRHPVGAFAVNQMADDIERAPTFFTPGVFTFISERPRFRQITQKCIESSGGASEKRYCVLQVIFHHAPQFVDSSFRETLIVSVLRRVRERPTLVMALWQQGELYRLYRPRL